MTEIEKLLFRTLYRKSFYEFYKGFWKQIDPHQYIDGDIVRFFCEVFQFMCRKWVGYNKPFVDTSYFSKDAEVVDIRDSTKDRLCLNMPPRHSKSKIFNVAGPTWLWSQYPIKAVSISHTFDLAKTMNEGRWSIINSQKFKEIYNINTIANTKDSIIDDRGGQLYSQNRNALTGYGGDMIINDDLTNAMTAYKDMTEMQNAWDYYQNTMPSRINDVNRSVIFNIQQRLGINDITGHILKERDLRNRYIFITLPAIFKKETYLVCPISGKVIHFNAGDGLWKERFGDYSALEAEVGESIFRTQYLQDPRATDKAIINEQMIAMKDKTEVPSIEQADMIYASHDFPVKDKEESDFLGSVLAYKVDGILYIIDCLEKHMNFPSSVNYVESLDRMYPSIVQVIEDKANGSPILQQLQGRVAGLQAYNPATNSKSVRLDNASMYMSNVVFVKNVFDKLTQEWILSENLNRLIVRLYEFPMVEHDDIVDAFSMLVNFVFLDKKFSVYGRAFDSKNTIAYSKDYENLYGAVFVNKDGDVWKVCTIKVKYGSESKILVLSEDEFRASMDDGIQKCFDYAPNAKVFVDCSFNQELAGKYQDKKSFIGTAIDDFELSVTNTNLAFSKKRVLVCKQCRGVMADIENFKFAKTKDEEAKYLTDRDGFVSCIRSAIKYFGNIVY